MMSEIQGNVFVSFKINIQVKLHLSATLYLKNSEQSK